MNCYLVKLKAKEYSSPWLGHVYAGWQQYVTQDDDRLPFFQTKKEFTVAKVAAPQWFIDAIEKERKGAEPESEERPETESSEANPIEDVPVTDLQMKADTLRALEGADIDTVGELIEIGLDNLTTISGIGGGRAEEIKSAIAALGEE